MADKNGRQPALGSYFNSFKNVTITVKHDKFIMVWNVFHGMKQDIYTVLKEL